MADVSLHAMPRSPEATANTHAPLFRARRHVLNLSEAKWRPYFDNMGLISVRHSRSPSIRRASTCSLPLPSCLSADPWPSRLWQRLTRAHFFSANCDRHNLSDTIPLDDRLRTECFLSSLASLTRMSIFPCLLIGVRRFEEKDTSHFERPNET